MSKYKNQSRLARNEAIGFDTRASFEDILEDAGHLYIARIVDRTHRCNCIAMRNDRFNEPDPTCKLCDDLGFLYHDKLIKVYKSYETGPKLTGSPDRFMTDAITFYIKYDIFDDRTEAELSRVMEIKTDANGVAAPGNIITAKYHIQDATPYIEKGIRVFWKLNVRRKDV